MNKLVPVAFHGQTLLATTIEGKPFVALKPIAEAIGLQWESQYNRLKRHPVLASTISITNMVAQDGKKRETVCLPLDKLNGWLFGIHANRAKPELRERLIQYQRECFDVLARHFGAATESRPYAVLPGQTLSAEQADELRRLLTDAAAKLPHAQQGSFLQRGWSKLKSHFGVPYRQIPASQYSEAVNLIARHALEATPALSVPAMQAPTATLDAHTLYRVWFLCNHFRHLFHIYRDHKVGQAFAWLGSPVGAKMHDHFLDGMSGGADALERKLGHHFNAARRYLRDTHGIQSGSIP